MGITCRWSEVQSLRPNNSRLFFGCDAKDNTAKVIKFVTTYGTEVHQALSDAGLAPILFDIQELKGGFKQVSCATASILSLHDATFPIADTTILHQRAQHRSNIGLVLL